MVRKLRRRVSSCNPKRFVSKLRCHWRTLAEAFFQTVLLIYSEHFKSNRGDATSNIAKREEAARQLFTHVAEMESAYSGSAKIVTIIAGDFNTDPTDARLYRRTFSSVERIFGLRRRLAPRKGFLSQRTGFVSLEQRPIAPRRCLHLQ
jgi:hypothetical protein